MLEIENMSLAYGNIRALRNVNLQVEKGQIVSMIGSNGAGKSSLIKAIFALEPVQSGRIIIDGEEVNSVNVRQKTHKIAASGVGIVPEGRRVFSGLSVKENLELGGYLLSLKKRKKQYNKMLALFPRLAEREQQRAGSLSGGEQQMLALARALMPKPHLLLLDEPSLGLAPLYVKDVMQSILHISKREKVTVLLVEQNARQALSLSQKSYILENGQIVKYGDGATLLNDPAVIAAYLGG